MYIGAATMALGGVTELAFGVKAEQQDLESIAKPLTAEEAEEGGEGEGEGEEAEAEGEQPKEGEGGERPREAEATPPPRQRRADAAGSPRTSSASAPAGAATARVPALSWGSPGMAASVPVPPQQLDREIDMIETRARARGAGLHAIASRELVGARSGARASSAGRCARPSSPERSPRLPPPLRLCRRAASGSDWQRSCRSLVRRGTRALVSGRSLKDAPAGNGNQRL